MRLILKLILTILFIPLFLVLLIAVTLRFQLLVPGFWQTTFSTNDTYSKLAISINKNLVSQTVAEGGTGSDVKILTDIISAQNLKDVIDKNIVNVLAFANGGAREIIVYVPINKIPKSLLSINFNKLTDQMPLTLLLKEFNVSGISPAQIQMISQVGIWSWIFLAVSIAISALILYLLYLLTDAGKRFVAAGLALVLAGFAAGAVYLVGTIIRINWTRDLAGSANTGDSIIGTVAPPVAGAIIRVWLIYAAAAVALGIILFFIKKSGYNKKQKS